MNLLKELSGIAATKIAEELLSAPRDYYVELTITEARGKKKKSLVIKAKDEDEAKDKAIKYGKAEFGEDLEYEAEIELVEDAYDDPQGGPGSMDNQKQGAMPQGSSTSQQGPEGSETPTPPPNSPQGTPPPPTVIAKADQYKVELGQDERVSLLDGSGKILAQMPLVIWKQLTRQ